VHPVREHRRDLTTRGQYPCGTAPRFRRAEQLLD